MRNRKREKTADGNKRNKVKENTISPKNVNHPEVAKAVRLRSAHGTGNTYKTDSPAQFDTNSAVPKCTRS
jgi:hypothetical protein